MSKSFLYTGAHERENIFPTRYAVPIRPPEPFDDSASPEELERYYEQFTVLRTNDTEKRLAEREEGNR